MGKYRKKPVVIEARQWNVPREARDLSDWAESFGDSDIGGIYYYDNVAGPSDPVTGDDWGLLEIYTLEGTMTVTPRDFVIRGVEGEFYACKPDIFAKTYEAVED